MLPAIAEFPSLGGRTFQGFGRNDIHFSTYNVYIYIIA